VKGGADYLTCPATIAFININFYCFDYFLFFLSHDSKNLFTLVSFHPEMALFPMSGVLRGLAHQKNCLFPNWKLISAYFYFRMGTS
jgi:hypothetical protein